MSIKNGDQSSCQKILNEIKVHDELVKSQELLEHLRKRYQTKFGKGFNDQAKLENINKPTCDVNFSIPSHEQECIKIEKTLSHQIKKGVSLVTCSKNRTANLVRSIRTWLPQTKIKEIIIVDWCSDEEVYQDLNNNGISDDRIKIIRVVDEPRWILSYAFNLGFQHTSYDKVLKVDADINLTKDFFKKNDLTKGTFIAGDWEKAEKGQEYINGFFYVYRADLLNIKGFNEYITTYGWDDDDIYDRLIEFGLKRKCVDVQTIHHLEHNDEERIGSIRKFSNALEELNSDTLFKIRANRYIAMILPRWKNVRKFIDFEYLKKYGNIIKVRRIKNKLPHYVSNEIRSDCEYYAALEILSWRLGTDVYHISRENFYEMLLTYKIEELSNKVINSFINRGCEEKTINNKLKKHKKKKLKLFIDAQHGLGNRLRAIASAAVLAGSVNRELVVVWEPDHHCNCNFKDLFQYNAPVVERSFLDAAYVQDMSVYNYMEVEPKSEKDQLIKLDTNKDAYIRSAYVLNCTEASWEKENAFLKSLKPTEEVMNLVKSFDLSGHIGVHIRMEGGAGTVQKSYDAIENWTDEGHHQILYWREKSHYSKFLKRIELLISEKSNTKLFLAADLPETYNVFKSLYQERTDSLRREVYDRSKEQAIYALADMILLSKCNGLLGSSWSSFSEIAIRLSENYNFIEMSGEDF